MNNPVHGEVRGVNLDHYHEEIKKIMDEIGKYNPSEFYNMDEGALFYEMLTSQTLSITAKIYGKIKSKQRVTIVFCTNMNGTNKHILLVIGQSIKPRCFNNFNHNAYVQ